LFSGAIINTTCEHAKKDGVDYERLDVG